MASNFLSKTGIVTTAKFKDRDETGQQFLHFKLLPDTNVLLPVQQLLEVLKISVPQIVPIPQLPPWVMGIHNWRGEILWLVDLGHLIGLPPIYTQATRSHYTTIVINHVINQDVNNQDLLKSGSKERSDRTLGLLIHQVEDIEWVNPDLIESPSPSTVSLELAPFLRGYFLNPNTERMVVLDSNAIFAAMPQSAE